MDAAMVVKDGAIAWAKPLGSPVWHLTEEGSRVRQPLCGDSVFAPAQRMSLANMKAHGPDLKRCQECRAEAYRRLYGNTKVVDGANA